MSFNPFNFSSVFAADEKLTPAGLSLAELLAKSEKNAALQKDFEALRKTAVAKLEQVQLMKILPVFDLQAYGGVVPDVKLQNPNDVNSFKSYDLENDFSVGHLGGFFRVEVNAVQPIYTFGKISNYVEMATKNIELNEWENKKKLGEIRQLVKKAYYTYLLASESAVILKDVEGRLNEAADKVEELLIKNSDNVTETDRLKIRVFLADVRNRSLDADRGQRLSRAALAELCELSGDWTLGEENLRAEEVSELKKEDAISMALRSQPELNQLEQGIQIKEAETRAIKADMFPSFFVGGKVQYGVAPGREDIKNPFLKDDFNFFDAGVVLGLKQDLGIFRTWKKAQGVEAEADRLKALRQQLTAKVKIEAEKAYEEAVSAQDSIRITEDGFRAARSWLTSASLAFNLGTAETKEILESFAGYFKARVDLVRSIYTLNMALTDLSDVSGAEVVDRLKVPNNP